MTGYPVHDKKIRAQAEAMMAVVPAADMHSHLGRFHEPANTAADSLAAMVEGGVALSVAATIGDAPVIARTDSGIRAVREAEPGELAAAAARGFEALRKTVAAAGAVLATDAGDIHRARGRGCPAVVSAAEGGDFLEGDVAGLERAWAAGVRVLQLVHYRVNELGDIQTEPPRHGGLTPFGAAVVREAERLGMIVDLAHATFQTSRGAIDVATRPVILSHTILGDAHRRCITAEHARMVAETGGVIGAWPSMLAVRDFAEFVEAILRLVDVVGVDHVGIGTDMDGVRNPVYTGYRDFRVIPEALLAAGLAPPEVGKIIGGNFVRVFAPA
jgi:membrane dipeptidase